MKIVVYKMHFQPGGAVDLYQEVTNIHGLPVLFLVGCYQDYRAARNQARQMVPDGCKLRLLNIQREDLARQILDALDSQDAERVRAVLLDAFNGPGEALTREYIAGNSWL